jgi:predicted nucleic acid-binding protein
MLVILSPQIVEEILSKSEDPKLKLSEEVIINFLKSISNNIIQINGDVKCDRLNKVDPSDNIILAAGLEGKVDYIVTADKGILNIKNYHTIQIVNPTQFLKECKDYQKFKHRSLQKV